MTGSLIILLQLSACFVGLFALAEVLHHFFKIKAEYTRKIVHVGTGLLTLLFPLYLEHIWQVVVICGAFLVLLFISMRFKLLHSINGIARKSAGSLLYPIIVIIVFVFYKFSAPVQFAHHLYFYMPILLMAICDPVAALAGKHFSGSGDSQGKKTWAGSTAFFVVALIVSYVLFYTCNTLQHGIAILLLHTIIISALTTVTEKWSAGGWDNFTIPLAAIAYLALLQQIQA